MDEGNLKRLILQLKLVHSIEVVKQKYINNKFRGALSVPYFFLFDLLLCSARSLAIDGQFKSIIIRASRMLALTIYYLLITISIPQRIFIIIRRDAKHCFNAGLIIGS
jgi:hypothetical protein